MNWKQVKSIKIKEGDVKSLSINSQVVWSKGEVPPEPPVEDHRFRFKNVSGAPNTVKLVKSYKDAPTIILEKSNNGVEFTTCDIYAGIVLAPDEVVYLRGNNGTFTIDGVWSWFNNTFTSTENIECHGSIMDLVDGGVGTTVIKNNLQFMSLFSGMSTLLTPPELPATTLTGYCYHKLFLNCTSLIKAPELPATELVDACYASIFSGCSLINYVKIGALSWSEQVNWLNRVAPTGTVEMPESLVTWDGTGEQPAGSIPLNRESGVPTGWTAKKPVVVNSFYIEDASGQPNTLSLTQTGAAPVKLEYSTDNKVWQEWIDCQTTTLPVAANSKVYLRGTNNVFSEDYKNNNKFNCTGEFNVGGDLTTLLVPEGNVLDLTGRNFIFCSLFIQSNVIDAGKLILPTTTLVKNCYAYMFQDCTSLTTAPELPATTLADYCYSGMFYKCTSLTTAPELPATILADSCYQEMFNGCTSLQTTPNELPATILANTCYYNMFKGCTSLTKVPDLSATTLAPGCCRNMFRDCTSLTTAPVLPATELANECYNGMFSGCTSLTQAPKLPATKLTVKGYYDMFSGCTSLTTAPVLPATELAKDCYNRMFQNCTSLIQAPVLPAMTLSSGCYYRMFENCTSLIQAPDLPATTLATSCYYDMFSGCGKLNYVKIGTTTWNNIYAYGWLSGTAATGTIEIPAELVTWDGTGTQPEGSIPLNSVNGVPTGWTAKKPVVEDHRFRFKNVSGAPNTLKLVKWGSAPAITLEKSSDGVSYTSFDCYAGVELQPDEVVYLRGVNGAFATDFTNYNNFTSTGNVECHGSVMDLCDGGTDTIEIKNNYQFPLLFQYMATLLTAPELPATTLAERCYSNMFWSCTSLTTTPELPATTLAEYCYRGMFYKCRSLTTAPELPATTLAEYCYNSMFRNCESLTQAPELPATTLSYECYDQMFQECYKLNYVKVGVTSWNYDYTNNWLKYVASSGTFTKPKGTNIPIGTSGIPEGWTVENI